LGTWYLEIIFFLDNIKIFVFFSKLIDTKIPSISCPCIDPTFLITPGSSTCQCMMVMLSSKGASKLMFTLKLPVQSSVMATVCSENALGSWRFDTTVVMHQPTHGISHCYPGYTTYIAKQRGNVIIYKVTATKVSNRKLRSIKSYKHPILWSLWSS
jgi:hypothetical protein